MAAEIITYIESNAADEGKLTNLVSRTLTASGMEVNLLSAVALGSGSVDTSKSIAVGAYINAVVNRRPFELQVVNFINSVLEQGQPVAVFYQKPVSKKNLDAVPIDDRVKRISLPSFNVGSMGTAVDSFAKWVEGIRQGGRFAE